ncbi:MAG: multidrug effflux MFS transporter [Gammaproteobacteria bacterium]|nr:multidrug effflux MFS transporter [Gammaproteobacteria bacterium]
MMHSKIRLQCVAALLIIFNFIANLANDIYLPSMPNLTEVFQTTSGTLQFTMSAWFAGVALPQLFFGPLSERIGRRPVILGGGICFIIATAFAALAINIESLIISRFFQGVGVCCLNVTSFSILTDLYEHAIRKKIINKLNIVGSLSLLLGPIIGGYFFIYYGWQSNFIFVFSLGALTLLGLYFALPESHLDLNPKALQFQTLFKNYFALSMNKIFIGSFAPYCLLLGGLIAYLTAAPFIIIGLFGVPPEQFGFTQLPIVCSYIGGALLIGELEKHFPRADFQTVGFVLVVLSGFSLLIMDYFDVMNLSVFIVGLSLYAMGFGFCSATLVADALSASQNNVGSAAAILGAGMASTCMLASASVGVLYNGTVASFSYLLVIISLTAFAIYLSIKKLILFKKLINVN